MSDYHFGNYLYLSAAETMPDEKILIVCDRGMMDNRAYMTEIDVYPFWKDRAILEIELLNENEEIRMPGFLKIIREVTDDEAYKNSYLARM